MTRKIVASTLAIAATTLHVAGTARAGLSYSGAFCQKFKDGSGYCYGTLKGFRASADPNASANFQMTSNGQPGFQANWGGGAMVCVAPQGSGVAALFPTVMGSSQYFQINWDALGQCNYLVVGSGSAY